MGSGKARRYTVRQRQGKGASVCTGIRGLMQVEAISKFRSKYLGRRKVEDKERGNALRLTDQNIQDKATKHANLLTAFEDGDYCAPIVARFNKVDAELE